MWELLRGLCFATEHIYVTFRLFLVRMSEKPNKAEKGKKQKNKTKERVLTWDYDLVAIVHKILVVFYTVINSMAYDEFLNF